MPRKRVLSLLLRLSPDAVRGRILDFLRRGN
jgi:hypothetical protein